MSICSKHISQNVKLFPQTIFKSFFPTALFPVYLITKLNLLWLTETPGGVLKPFLHRWTVLELVLHTFKNTFESCLNAENDSYNNASGEKALVNPLKPLNAICRGGWRLAVRSSRAFSC